jgi:Tfp pilus assembly protein PilN
VRLATPSLYDRRVIAIFALGVLSVVVYLPVHSSYVQVLEEPYMVGADLAQGMIWILGMLFYGMSFVGLTTSFTLLAIVEYGKQSGETQDLASRREEVLKTENQELKEKLAELQRHVDRLQERLTHHEQLKAENQQLRQQVAELQSLADDLSTRLAPYEEEKRVLKQNQLVTAVGRITQSAVADTLKQRILEIAGVRDAIVSMTVQRQSRDKGLFYGPGVDRVDTSVFLVLEAGIDISVATRATKSIAEQVLRELKLDAGETSVSVDYAL